MNSDVIWCVAILVVLCVIGAIGCRVWLSNFSDQTSVPFIPIVQDPNYESMLTFWTFVIILQVMIPLSLYVTIEMAKVGQVYHIGHDIALYDAETGRSAECRALNITEELGQVSKLIELVRGLDKEADIYSVLFFYFNRCSTYSLIKLARSRKIKCYLGAAWWEDRIIRTVETVRI